MMTNPTVQPRPAAIRAVLLLVIGSCPALLLAQGEPVDDASPMRTSRRDLIRQSDVRLIDDEGKLVPLLGFTLDEFNKLQDRALEDEANERRISVDGTVELLATVDKEKAHCTLDVTYSVLLYSRDESEEVRWIPVPLRLDHAIVDLSSIEFQTSNDFFLHKDGDGFVVWIHAKPNTEHTIKLQAKGVITETGGTRTLDVKLPNLITKCRVVIPRLGLTVQRHEERSFISKEQDGRQTVIKVDNAGGGVSIGWAEQPPVKPLVEVRGTMRVDIHANHVSSQATLAVRSRGEPISSFVVYMPPGMELTSQQVPGFRIATSDDPQRRRQAVAVRRVEGPTSDVIEITLRAAAPELGKARRNRSLEVAGFDVKEADLQLGTIDIAVRGNWSVTWKPDPFVQPEPRVVADDPTAVTARFLYDRQPFSLEVELERKQPRLRVAAEYTVRVAEAQADLEADIHYETTGIETGAIKLTQAGWNVESVQLGGMLLADYEIDDNDVLTIPVDSSATTLDILITAQQPLPADEDSLALRLPRPVDPAQPPVATVLVLPAENVELTPQVPEMKWLVEAAVPNDIELPSTAAPPFFYREELSADANEPSLFVARKRIRSRTVDASVASVVDLEDTDLRVEQEITLAIAYGAINSLVVDVPASVLDSGTLVFSIDDQTAPYELLETDDDTPPDLRRVRVDLPSERTGMAVLRVQYKLAGQDVYSSEAIRAPLVQPMEGDSVKFNGNTLTASTDESRALALSDDGWTLENGSAQPLAHNVLRLRAAGVTRAASIRTTPVERQSSHTTNVSRAWIQTIVSDSVRIDRAVFRLVSDEAQLNFQLPAFVDANSLGVALNGQEAEFVSDDEMLRVVQPEALLGRDVAVEISYAGEAAANGRSALPSVLPKLEEAQRIERVYWELLLPRNRHLLRAPASVTPELIWQFKNLYWGPTGRLGQRDLEGLLAASSQDVPENMNRYLFSATGAVSEISYSTVDRLTLMLVFSLLALVSILPFFYLTPLRHPAAYFTIGIVVAALAVTFPEQAVIFGQAGAIGVMLALVACVLRRVVGTPGTAAVPTRSRLQVSADSKPTGPVFTEGSSRATTATAPAHLQVARVEAES